MVVQLTVLGGDVVAVEKARRKPGLDRVFAACSRVLSGI
jgi:hypothetical protein